MNTVLLLCSLVIFPVKIDLLVRFLHIGLQYRLLHVARLFAAVHCGAALRFKIRLTKNTSGTVPSKISQKFNDIGDKRGIADLGKIVVSIFCVYLMPLLKKKTTCTFQIACS